MLSEGCRLALKFGGSRCHSEQVLTVRADAQFGARLDSNGRWSVMSETIPVHGRKHLARGMIFLCALAFVSAARATAQESNVAPEMSSPMSTAGVSTPNLLQALVQEALSRSPVVLAARSHWQAQTK